MYPSRSGWSPVPAPLRSLASVIVGSFRFIAIFASSVPSVDGAGVSHVGLSATGVTVMSSVEVFPSLVV